MNLIETIALRRSGHHAVMSWFIKNLVGMSDWSHKITVQGHTKVVLWNDASYNDNYEIKLLRDLGFTPKTLFINYEDRGSTFSSFGLNNIYKGTYTLTKYPDFNISNSKRILVIRDFYNNLCSRLTQNKKQEFQFDVAHRFIFLWKEHAKAILNNKVHHIRYEDWLLDSNIRSKFLQDVFGTKEIIGTDRAEGFWSSYINRDKNKMQGFKKDSTENYLNRFNPDIIPNYIKDLIRNDNELHYLIGSLGYEYKKL